MIQGHQFSPLYVPRNVFLISLNEIFSVFTVYELKERDFGDVQYSLEGCTKPLGFSKTVCALTGITFETQETLKMQVRHFRIKVRVFVRKLQKVLGSCKLCVMAKVKKVMKNKPQCSRTF